MARIKIKDLPKDQKISIEEMKRVFGGSDPYGPPRYPRPPYNLGGNERIIGFMGGPKSLLWGIRPPLYEFPEGSIPSANWVDK